MHKDLDWSDLLNHTPHEMNAVWFWWPRDDDDDDVAFFKSVSIWRDPKVIFRVTLWMFMMIICTKINIIRS